MAIVNLTILPDKTFNNSSTDITNDDLILLNSASTAADVKIGVLSDKIEYDVLATLIQQSGASKIGFTPIVNSISATNVQDAIGEVKTDVLSSLSSIVDVATSGSKLVGYVPPSGSVITANNVQDAVSQMHNGIFETFAVSDGIETGATKIGFNPSGGLSSDDVQSVIIELNSKIISTSGASYIGFTPDVGNNIASTNVQSAIVEVKTDILSGLSASSGSSLVGYVDSLAGVHTVQSKLREFDSLKSGNLYIWKSNITYEIGEYVISPVDQNLYKRINTAGSGEFDPSITPSLWLSVGATQPTIVNNSGTEITALSNKHYLLSANTKVTVTLPLTPSIGDQVWVTPLNGLFINEIARNGNTIELVAENLIIDKLNITVKLCYTTATISGTVYTSWRIL
jgi:hypothetical protein